MPGPEDAICPHCNKPGLNYLGYCFFCNRVTNPTPELISLEYKQGLSLDEIKEKYELSLEKFSSLLEQAKIREKPKVEKRELTEAVLEAVKKGMTHEEIKKRFHIGSRTLYSILESAGLVKHRKPLTEEEKQEIIKAYKEGVKVQDICRRFHRTTRTIMKILRSAGVELRSSRSKQS